MRVTAAVLGHFGEGTKLLNGQTVKTKIITEELQKQLGQNQVLKIDTHGGWKTLLKAPFQVFYSLKNSANVLIFPAQNGLRIYAPLLSFQRLFFKKRKIHYVVIGGWLPDFLKRRKILARHLQNFDGIYVETNTMKRTLKEQGFKNVTVMPNCKTLDILSEKELVYPKGMPYRLCTFSRVMKEKGIEDAVNAVKQINEQLGKTIYSLDIYGQIDQKQTEWFDNLKKLFPEYIHYCGSVSFDKSVEVLKNYFALLFPTHFYTEGIPGTIIDAYAAGIPVVSAKWENYADVVIEGETGLGYEIDNINELERLLLNIAHNSTLLLNMKKKCLNEAEKYKIDNAVKILFDRIEDN